MTMRRLGYGTLVFLCMGLAIYAVVVYAFMPLGVAVHPGMRPNFELHRAGILTHVFASVVAVALGPLQFATRLRAARPRLHRWTGRVYLGLGVLVGGVAGFYMAFHAFAGPIAQLGFGLLALAWLYTGLRAYLAIRRGDVASHRRWMVRNFALTLAAVTLRLWLPGLIISGLEFETAYRAVAWLCWVPNVLLAEVFNAPATHAHDPARPLRAR